MLRGKGIMSDLQRRILGSFNKLPDSSYFYLSGGTALAEFYLGHRKSYDLDVFTVEERLILPFSRIVEKELIRERFYVDVIRRFSSFVEFEVTQRDEATKVQLAYDSPFRFEEPVDCNLGIKVNHYKDITVDKLLAFFGRAEPRDAIDLFFILKKENIWELADLAVEKDPGFDLYWLAVAMNEVKDFPDHITRWPVEMLIEINVEELKRVFSRISIEIMNRLKK
ncbi:MAG: nucleotidyl transferase AbiEii/AbiGii toxin family protein [Deltaproteobacteria bacterium]|nr:nucleotidyl transferase AbiEii/AbiGii toxin family protein [Deltaproteobacteria bacterium]MBW1796003.1 nucleotidyl transferase AbiEii/AbiGii toxin family protein [Deltaproteobacteria bacterium]